jgi:hypothetical protein
MNIWLFKEQSNTATLSYRELRDGDQLDLMYQNSGKRIINEWKPMSAYIDRGTPEGFVYFVGIPTCAEDSWKKIQPSVISEIEGLPLTIDNDTFYVLNVINVLDCLDMSSSKFVINPLNKRIMAVTKFVFLEEALKDTLIFRIPEEPRYIFATDRFRNLISKKQINGLEFYPCPSPFG